MHEGSLYVGGGNSTQGEIYKLVNDTWIGMSNAFLSGAVTSITSFDGKLIVGQLENDDERIDYYDGDSWHNIVHDPILGTVTDMTNYTVREYKRVNDTDADVVEK